MRESCYLGEIRGFTGSYEPAGWMYCNGQTLKIDEYAALFAVMGVNFGGDARTYFKLPDLRGRVPVHVGTGPGLTQKFIGEINGFESIRLTEDQMPIHDHAAKTTVGTASLSGNVSATMHVNNETGDQSTPNNHFLGLEAGEAGLYAQNKDASSVLNTNAITVDTSGLKVDVTGINVGIDDAGGSGYHYNMQPYLVINWIVCTEGLFPSRT